MYLVSLTKIDVQNVIVAWLFESRKWKNSPTLFLNYFFISVSIVSASLSKIGPAKVFRAGMFALLRRNANKAFAEGFSIQSKPFAH